MDPASGREGAFKHKATISRSVADFFGEELLVLFRLFLDGVGEGLYRSLFVWEIGSDLAIKLFENRKCLLLCLSSERHSVKSNILIFTDSHDTRLQ
jgi:hypothetical protein